MERRPVVEKSVVRFLGQPTREWRERAGQSKLVPGPDWRWHRD